MLNLKTYHRPPSVNAPGYFWLLNGPLNERTLREQLRDMARVGAKTVCPHPLPPEFRKFFHSQMPKNYYLTPDYFKMYQVIVDECKRLGMNCYLYDEGGWPSGGACGQVFASDPVRFRRKMVVLDGQGGYKIELDAINPDKSVVPDILAKGCTETFLKLTHERYLKAVGDHFGKNIRFTFTDEPAMVLCYYAQMTWTDDFAEEFQRRKGYDVRPYLVPLLQWSFDSKINDVRVDFHDVAASLYVERYMLPIRDWCRKHGLKSGGHVCGEDSFVNLQLTDFGHPLRTLRALDEPGVDLVLRQLWPGERLHPFPKLASSVGNQGGNRHILGELFGVYGNGLTFGQMQFLVDYMLLNGVNTFIFGGRPFTTEDGMEGTRPHFGPVNPQWWCIKPFHEYVARQSRLSTDSTPVVATALFLDIRTMWGELRKANYSAEKQLQLAERLLAQQSDFDYIDDDVLATARIHHGKLKIGRALYDRVVIPVNANLAPEARKNLARLKAAGFAVLSSDETQLVPPTLKVIGGDWRLRVRKHRRANGDVLYFIMNISEKEITADFQAEEQRPVAYCDSWSGRVFTFKTKERGAWRWTFRPYSMTVFLLAEDMSGAVPEPPLPSDAIAELKGGWKIKPLRQVTVGEHDFIVSDCKASAKAVRLGDWKDALGEDFSGEAEYCIVFDGGKARSASFVDLGDVKYSATVYLNGKCLGTRLCLPYVFPVGEAMKDGRNTLTVRVVNTLANAMAPQEILERWQKQFQPQSLFETRQRSYERESLPSGLFGPVLLRSAASTNMEAATKKKATEESSKRS